MTVVSSKEFATHQDKYYDLAVSEEVLIEKGNDKFHLVHAPFGKTYIPPQPILEPDEEFYSSITVEELLVGIHEDIDKMFAKKKCG